jgi:hypothetical protein
VHVTYIGTHDEVEIPVLGLFVARGQAFEVSDEDAGRPPVLDGDEPDLGEGLLSQVDNFREATKAEIKAAQAAPAVPAPAIEE